MVRGTGSAARAWGSMLCLLPEGCLAPQICQTIQTQHELLRGAACAAGVSSPSSPGSHDPPDGPGAQHADEPPEQCVLCSWGLMPGLLSSMRCICKVH